MNDRIPLIPKVRGGPLRVLMLGRISTPGQDLESIDAGHRDVRIHLSRIYDGPLHVKELGGRGSGMRTDRESIVEAEEEAFLARPFGEVLAATLPGTGPRADAGILADTGGGTRIATGSGPAACAGLAPSPGSPAPPGRRNPQPPAQTPCSRRVRFPPQPGTQSHLRPRTR